MEGFEEYETVMRLSRLNKKKLTFGEGGNEVKKKKKKKKRTES